VPSRPRLTTSGPRCGEARTLTRALATAAAALLGAAACTGLDEASAARGTHDDQVAEIASQLARVSGLTYTATYHLTGGDVATVSQAQRPARTAYLYPGGRLIKTPTGTIRCEGDEPALTCTATDPIPATGAPLNGTTLVTPEAVLAMLDTAALDPELTTTQRDTTIAGRHATCLNLQHVDGTPAAEFSLCVTNEGALGSFTATLDGRRIDQALTAFEEEATPATFTLPSTAKLTDRRTRG
jgi:hypothetical protein